MIKGNKILRIKRAYIHHHERSDDWVVRIVSENKDLPLCACNDAESAAAILEMLNAVRKSEPCIKALNSLC